MTEGANHGTQILGDQCGRRRMVPIGVAGLAKRRTELQ